MTGFLASMLATSVTPLGLCKPTNSGKRDPWRSGNPNPAHELATAAKHAKTLRRYREAMGDEWVATADIENRLGAGPSGLTGTLLAWLKKGILERRKIGPEEIWNRRKGYEWRFCQ